MQRELRRYEYCDDICCKRDILVVSDACFLHNKWISNIHLFWIFFFKSRFAKLFRNLFSVRVGRFQFFTEFVKRKSIISVRNLSLSYNWISDCITVDPISKWNKILSKNFLVKSVYLFHHSRNQTILSFPSNKK